MFVLTYFYSVFIIYNINNHSIFVLKFQNTLANTFRTNAFMNKTELLCICFDLHACELVRKSEWAENVCFVCTMHTHSVTLSNSIV